MTVTCIIPARMGSSRFPGKPLKKIQGRELILRCCDIANQSELVDNFVVATEDVEIEKVVTDAGFICVLTAPFPSCTHRVSLVAQHLAETDYIVNLQGDEPCVTPQMLDDMIQYTIDNDFKVVQATYELDYTDIQNEDIVKAVINNDRVINLTRVPEIICNNLKGIAGLYVYTHTAICNYPGLDLGLVEAWKGLDTFGFIGAYPVVPFDLPYRTHAVDRPIDISIVEAKLS